MVVIICTTALDAVGGQFSIVRSGTPGYGRSPGSFDLGKGTGLTGRDRPWQRVPIQLLKFKYLTVEFCNY